MKLCVLLVLGLTFAFIQNGWSQDKISSDEIAAAVPASRMVKTWVAPYAVDISMTRLNERYATVGPRNALTHLGLQFWWPTASGGLERVNEFAPITDEKIKQFRRWGQKNGVKVLLTVFNAKSGQWNWALAKSAFGDNPGPFIKALIKEMEAHGLDGIDIDLEGPAMDPTPEEKAQYVAFIKDLGRKLRARGKHLVLDSFSYIWNAPNTNWWPELFPHVDGIVSMGYQEIGRGASPDSWQSYAWQKAEAGRHAAKLLIGMPSHLNEWFGNTAAQQIDWVKPARRKVGVAIWDAQNQAAAWRSAPVWRRLNEIRDQ